MLLYALLCLAILLGTKGDLGKFREKWAQGSGFCWRAKGQRGALRHPGLKPQLRRDPGRGPEGPIFHAAPLFRCGARLRCIADRLIQNIVARKKGRILDPALVTYAPHLI